MKIVFLDIKTLGEDLDLSKFNKLGKITTYDITKPSETIEKLVEADIVVTNKVVIDKNVIDNTNLKMIQVAATGMNNIDLDYAKKKKIVVKNVNKYSTNSVAQITFSLIFKFLSKIDYFDEYGKNKWCRNDIFTHIVPFNELSNLNIGIIGLGTIGKKVASIFNEFGSKIYYYSTSKSNYDTNFIHLDLDTLLKTCDILSIHAPLNQNTKNLINKNNLKYIKNGSILLNLGRGGIVNEKDIANELDKREIFYATDVISSEPIDCNNPLLKVKNKNRLIITPHIAWASIESRKRLINSIYKNIEEFIDNFDK